MKFWLSRRRKPGAVVPHTRNSRRCARQDAAASQLETVTVTAHTRTHAHTCGRTVTTHRHTHTHAHTNGNSVLDTRDAFSVAVAPQTTPKPPNKIKESKKKNKVITIIIKQIKNKHICA